MTITTITKKMRSASRIAAISIAAISFTTSIAMASDAPYPGYVGTTHEPGNSAAALNDRNPACIGQALSTSATRYGGLDVQDPPLQNLETIDILFWAGSLFQSSFDCAQIVD